MPEPLKSRRPLPICLTAIALAAGLVLAHVGATAATAASGSSAATGISWQAGTTDAEVDRAFAAARAAGKPLFLYWGAVWCPPCNQVKATLFPRADFIERSRAFVPVYVDGDKPGAQKIAARFRVQGYPTMVLFKPDGTEITRLPGEVDPERYLLALSAGIEAQVPVKDLVRRALAGTPMNAQEWRLLAFYSWDTDQEQVIAARELGPRLAELAARAPADMPEIRDRLALKSLAAQAGSGSADPASTAARREVVERLLLDPAAAAMQVDLLTGYAAEIVSWLASSGEQRQGLAKRWDEALVRLVKSNPALSKATQVDVLDARIALWKLAGEGATLSAARQSEVLAEVARIAAATSDRYERQAVIPAAAHVLTAAGLTNESDDLLKLELPRAVAPYYHMLGLAANARKRGDAKTALRWYEQAWRKSEGPATRLQWGAGYLGHLMDLAPDDVGRIEGTARTLLSELQPKSETFYERNQRALTRMSARLLDWQGQIPARRQAVVHVKRQLAGMCAKLPAKDPGRANCTRVFPAA